MCVAVVHAACPLHCCVCVYVYMCVAAAIATPTPVATTRKKTSSVFDRCVSLSLCLCLFSWHAARHCHYPGLPSQHVSSNTSPHTALPFRLHTVLTSPPLPSPPLLARRRRLGAFFVGVGVGGVFSFFKLSEDIWDSSAEVEKSIGGLKDDLAGVNSELRRRVAALEHELANLKKN